jgi:hypothetical protein
MKIFKTDFNRCLLENEKPMANKIRWKCIGKEITKHKTNDKYE